MNVRLGGLKLDFIEILKVIFLGIVEGITEWLPVSSTGHMILFDEFVKLNMSEAFKEMFFVVIQLGAIMAVVCLYWDKLFPFEFKNGFKVKSDTMNLWFKIIAACLPAAVIGLLFDDWLDEHFYNYQTVSLMLIVYGILFIVIENRNKTRRPVINNLSQITYKFIKYIYILIKFKRYNSSISYNYWNISSISVNSRNITFRRNYYWSYFNWCITLCGI